MIKRLKVSTRQERVWRHLATAEQMGVPAAKSSLARDCGIKLGDITNCLQALARKGLIRHDAELNDWIVVRRPDATRYDVRDPQPGDGALAQQSGIDMRDQRPAVRRADRAFAARMRVTAGGPNFANAYAGRPG